MGWGWGRGAGRLASTCDQAAGESSTMRTSCGWQSSRCSVFVVRSRAGFQASTCGERVAGVCVRVCVRACVSLCVRACVRVCAGVLRVGGWTEWYLPWLKDGVVRVEVMQRLVHVLARAHRVEVHAEELAHLCEEVEHAWPQLHFKLHVLHGQRHLRLRALGQRRLRAHCLPRLLLALGPRLLLATRLAIPRMLLPLPRRPRAWAVQRPHCLSQRVD